MRRKYSSAVGCARVLCVSNHPHHTFYYYCKSYRVAYPLYNVAVGRDDCKKTYIIMENLLHVIECGSDDANWRIMDENP